MAKGNPFGRIKKNENISAESCNRDWEVNETEGCKNEEIE